MTATPRPQHRQRQLFLALLLLLVGQFALTLHSHDLSLHPADAGECAVCLVGNANGHALISYPPIAIPVVKYDAPPLLSTSVVFGNSPKHTYSRGPPVLLI